MEDQALLYHPAVAARVESLHALVRNVIRQPLATSDTLLCLADAFSELDGSPTAARLAAALRELASCFTAPSAAPGAALHPARALIRLHPMRAARIRQLAHDCPMMLEAAEVALLSALARAADVEEGHSP